MGENSKIEWTHHTFNPWIGCQKVSPGCDHCYAEAQNEFRKWNSAGWGPHASRRRASSGYWKQPLKWDREAAAAGERRRVFCASLADVFDNHGSITSGWRGDLWHLIARTPNLDWLLLTKRPQNIAKMLPDGYGAPAWGDGWPNVWLGTTVENREEMSRRGPALAAMPAKVRFWSAEPLICSLEEIPREIMPSMIIVGGESGAGARPMHPNWARSIRDQCKAAGTAFFFKQWGEWTPVSLDRDDDDEGGLTPAYPVAGCGADASAHHGGQECLFWQGDRLVHWPHVETFPAIGVRRVGKRAAGSLLDGREHKEFPR